MVPRSFSLTMAMAVRMTSDSISRTQMMPGTMKFTLRSSGLNHTRGSAVTSGWRASSLSPPPPGTMHVDRLRERDLLQVRHRDRRGVGVAAVDGGHDLRRLAGRQPPGEVGRDDQRHARRAAVEQVVDVVDPPAVGADPEVAAARELVDVGAALGRLAVVAHREVDVVDVGGDDVAEDEQLDDRHHEHEAEHAPVAADLDDLLPDDLEDAGERGEHDSFTPGGC